MYIILYKKKLACLNFGTPIIKLKWRPWLQVYHVRIVFCIPYIIYTTIPQYVRLMLGYGSDLNKYNTL